MAASYASVDVLHHYTHPPPRSYITLCVHSKAQPEALPSLSLLKPFPLKAAHEKLQIDREHSVENTRNTLLRWARSANSMFQSLALSVSLSPTLSVSLSLNLNMSASLSPRSLPHFWPVCLSQKLHYPATSHPPFVPPSFTCCPLVHLCQRVRQLKVSSFFLFRRIVA